MAITKDDIKLLESERLTDTDDGGGRMTGVEVVDGQVNNLYNDISRLDRTIGRVSLRKAFVAVQTALNEVYAGAHAIITNPPADGGVHVTLFSTGDDDDERNAAKNRIENYTISGPVSRIRLYDRHVTGQRTLQVFLFPTDELPEIGEVYALSKGEGTGSEYTQFFRILKIDFDDVVFTNSQYGTYTLKVLNMEIDTPLQRDFSGYVPAPRDDLLDAQFSVNDPERPLIRKTSVADAARYFGVVPLAEAVTANDVDIMADSIFSAIVPSTQAESPLTDVLATNDTPQYKSAGDEITIAKSPVTGQVISGSTYVEFFVGGSIAPGTFRAKLEHYGAWTGEIADDGQGGSTYIVQAQLHPDTRTGNFIDYEIGRVRLRISDSGGTYERITLYFEPAVRVVQVSTTKQVEITVQNRQLTYTDFLKPIPAPGSLNVSYRALSKWYTLRDDGDGVLVPDVASTGGGTINYATGSIALTTAFEPDVGSSVIYQWGTAVHYNQRVGETIPVKPGITLKASAGNCEPNSVTITWESNSVSKSVTDDGNGNLTGDGTGRILYQTGQAYFVPNAYPDPNVLIQFAYDYGAEINETFTPSKDGNGFISLTAGTTPIKPGSCRVSWTTTRTAQVKEMAANSRN